ncbi:MAG: polysaccharide biosynthesis tyrosine autokinase [Aeromicrobium sp.]
MSLAQFIAVLRKRWMYVAVPFVVALLVAGISSALQAPTYVARASAYFTLPFGQSANDLFQGANYTQQQLGSYASLATKPIVLQPVIDELGLDTTPRALAGSVSATASADSVIVDIAVSSESPGTAAELANAITTEMGQVVKRLSPKDARGQASVDVVTVAKATAPQYAATPNTKKNLLAAGLAGIFLGLLAALARDRLDTRLRTASDLPDGINVLSAIEFDRGVKSRPGQAMASTDTRRAAIRNESFRRLRTNLRFLDVDSSVQVIVVTSSVAAEGKTSTILDLARVLAQDHQRVLVVDADMRRPKIAEYLALEGSVGLADVLAGTAALDDAVQNWQHESLFVLPSGSIPPNPSELLGSHAMTDLVGVLRERFDFVLIDTPPLVPVIDAAIAGVLADGVLLVVRYGHTTEHQFSISRSSLASVEARALGVVFNKTPAPRPWTRRSSYDYYQRSTGPTVSRHNVRDWIKPRNATKASSSPDGEVDSSGPATPKVHLNRAEAGSVRTVSPKRPGSAPAAPGSLKPSGPADRNPSTAASQKPAAKEKPSARATNGKPATAPTKTKRRTASKPAGPPSSTAADNQ